VGTESFPAESFENWEQVEKHPWVVGDFVWTGWDYLGESGIGRSWREGEEPGDFLGPWPWHVAGCGDIDILGRKPHSTTAGLWRPVSCTWRPSAAAGRRAAEGHALGVAGRGGPLDVAG
jgi:beta-galactosidase